MSQLGAAAAMIKVDGRHARRDHNRELVLRAARDLFQAENLVPSIEVLAERCGLSVRSLYRYFADAESLIAAAIEQSMTDGIERARIPHFGAGDFEERLDAFVNVRVKLYESSAAGYRATMHHAPNITQLRDALQRTRRFLRDQTLTQFASELDALPSVERRLALITCDCISQFDSLEHLRRFHRCSVADTKTVVRQTITSALRGTLEGVHR